MQHEVSGQEPMPQSSHSVEMPKAIDRDHIGARTQSTPAEPLIDEALVGRQRDRRRV